MIRHGFNRIQRNLDSLETTKFGIPIFVFLFFLDEDGTSFTYIFFRKDVGSLDWSVTIPDEGYGYVVYENEALFFNRHVIGNHTKVHPASSSSLGALALVGLELSFSYAESQHVKTLRRRNIPSDHLNHMLNHMTLQHLRILGNL